MNEILLVGGMAWVTVAIRYPIIALSGRIKLPPQFLQMLRYVPPAVLTAIVFPAVIMPENTVWLTHTNARLIGAIVAVLVGIWRKNLLLTIVVGMLVFFVWQWLMTMLGTVASPVQ